MRLTQIGATGCVNGSCPTVYTSDRGTVVVQGYVVRPSDAHVAVPDGESLVEIPRALLIDAVAIWASKGSARGRGTSRRAPAVRRRAR